MSSSNRDNIYKSPPRLLSHKPPRPPITPRIGTELHAQPVLLEDFFHAQKKNTVGGHKGDDEDDHLTGGFSRGELDQRGNDFYRYQLRANFVDIAREDYQESLNRSRGEEGGEASRFALNVQLFTLERRIGVVSAGTTGATSTQNQQSKLQQAQQRQRQLQQQQQQQDGYRSGAISPANGSSGWESNTSSTMLSERSGQHHRKHHPSPFEGSGYHSGANKSVVDIAMNFTNFLGWTNYRTDNRITDGSASSRGGAEGSTANEKYPTEPSTVKEVHRKPRELCAVAAAYEDVHTNPKFATSRFILVSACVSKSTETTTRTTPQFQHEMVSSTSSSTKGIAQKFKNKKKVVVVTSDSTSFPARQSQDHRDYQQQQNVRVLAPKIEISHKEIVETFLLVRSIGGYREMVLKPTTAALPWYPGEENEVTCIALAPFGGRALVGTVSGKCYIVDLGTTLNPKFMPAVDEERRKENDSDEDSETNRINSDNLAKTPETFKMKEAIRVLAEDSKKSAGVDSRNENQRQPAKARSVVWWRRAKDNKEIAICGDSTGVVRLWDVESGELLMTIPTKCNPLKKLQLVEAIDDRRVHEILKQQSQKYYNSEESLTSDFSSATTTGDKANSKMASSSSTFLLLSKRVARERDEHGNIIRTMDRVNSMRQKFRESRMSINENYEENYDNEYRENVDEDDDMDDEFNTYKDVDTYFQTLDLETYSARIDEISCVPEQNILFSGPEKVGSRFGHDGYETHESGANSPDFQGGVLVSRPANFTGHSTLEHGGKSFVVSSFADGRVDIYDAKVSDSKVIASIRTPNYSSPRFAYIVDAFAFFVMSSRSIAVISRATNTLVQKIVLPVEYGAIKGLVRGIPVRSSKYELAIDLAADIRADGDDDDNDDDDVDEDGEDIGRNSIILEGVVCWTTSRVFEITPTASVFDLYEKLALSGRISRARELADALALDASEMALHACERALNARRGDTAAAMYYFAVRSDSDSPQKRYKMLARFCDACLRSWHVRATEHLLETMDAWDFGANGFDSEPSSPAATFSRWGSRAGSRAGSLGGSPSHSGSKQQTLRSSNNNFAAEKSFRADSRECLKRSRDRDIEVAVQTARIARANIIAWSSKEGVACLKSCDELLDAEVSASASTTVVIIRDDGTEEEITREQFEGIENDAQFEPKLADSEFIKEFVDNLARTCCSDSPSSEQFDNERDTSENENIPKWQRMENAIKAFEEGNHNAFKQEGDLSVGDAFRTPTDSPMKKNDTFSNNESKGGSSGQNHHLFEAKRANGRTRDRTNAPKTQSVSVHMRTVGSLVRALNVGSSEEDILFGKRDSKDVEKTTKSESNIEGRRSATKQDDENNKDVGEDFENQLKQNNIPRSLSIALPTLFWALGEEGRTNALSYNHTRNVGPGGNTSFNTNISPSVSPRSSDQNSENSKTAFNTNKLFDIAYHNQKASATFQKRIVNPELRVNCLLAHVAMEPANSERKVHYQRELEAEIKRAVIHSRNLKADDDITSEGRVLLQIVGSAIAWSNDAALSTVAAQLGHFESANAFRVDIADRLLSRIDEAKNDERIIREDNETGENDETLRLLAREVVLSKHAIERELKFAFEHLAPKCKDAKKRALCTKEIAKRWKSKHMKDFLTWDEFERMALRTMPPEEGELTTFELLKMSFSGGGGRGEDEEVRLKYSANFALKCAIAPSLPSLGSVYEF